MGGLQLHAPKSFIFQHLRTGVGVGWGEAFADQDLRGSVLIPITPCAWHVMRPSPQPRSCLGF